MRSFKSDELAQVKDLLYTVYLYENDSMHSYYGVCTSCGQRLEGYGYSGWLNHNFSGNTCMQCGFTKACSHFSAVPTYSQYDITSHRSAMLCQSCGIVFNTTIQSHSWSYGPWSSVSDTQHQRVKSCICGAMSSESSTHYFSGEYQDRDAQTLPTGRQHHRIR